MGIVSRLELASVQMRTLLKWGAVSLLFSAFKWFYSSDGNNCSGFDSFPTLGLGAFSAGWYYDMSLTYIGVGVFFPDLGTSLPSQLADLHGCGCAYLSPSLAT